MFHAAILPHSNAVAILNRAGFDARYRVNRQYSLSPCGQYSKDGDRDNIHNSSIETVVSNSLKNHKAAFGKALREIRIECKTTQEALALTSDLDRSFISHLETGEHSPTLGTMLTLCDSLGVSLDVLIERFTAKFEESDG